MNKIKLLFISGFVLLLLVFSSPFWLWKIQPTTNLNVLIIDKTVPDHSYREHKGLTWLLNHLKLTKKNGQAYSVTEDYVGFIPSENPPDYDIRKLPDDLSSFDVIYLADGYGVYDNEYIKENEEGARSELIYGGMTLDEVDTIKHSLYENNQTFIAEFNTFGSPTKKDVKEQFYQLLQVEWTGWIGRAFHDLSNEEVPNWLRENYEQQYGERYNFQGYGLAFVSEQDEVIILTDRYLDNQGAKISFTEFGEKEFQIDGSYSYEYWFDIVEAHNNTTVGANFELPLSKLGEEQLHKNGLPTEFPAVIHHQHPAYQSYYFAGDFVDQADIPNFYEAAGITWWKSIFQTEKKGRTDTFFWKAFVPMMKGILNQDQPDFHTTNSDDLYVKNKINIVGNVGDDNLQIYRDGDWEDFVIKGVNMGIAKPGYFPGETAISKKEYARWFEMISNMNANAIRVYTIHPPAFYEALYEHNMNREDPLYLFHGVWINEEQLYDKKDAFDEQITTEFKEELKQIINIVHGNANLKKRAGHASGQYFHDISKYVLGWIIGVEWDPEVVVATNAKNSTKQNYDGTYMQVTEGSPFEVWLADIMDYTATYEAETYHTQRPISFTNWVTTDLLEHPSEPMEKEDMVSIDPNVIQAKDNFYPGVFASYHIYPYYPDFLNLENKYISYVDHRGKKNNYAGYLHDLKKHHDLPILVAEFGIPASRGMTHTNVYGMNQGFHSEQEQGKYVSQLFEDIVHENMAGGLVFSWQDEWFKRTWNTMDYDNPDERPYWDNIQTNEQHFGLLSFDPQTKETLINLDGKMDDWKAREEIPVHVATDGMIEQIYITSDERGVYVRLEFGANEWDVSEYQTFLLLDTISNQGQASIPEIPNLMTDGVDFVVHIQDNEKANVLVDSYYDTFYYHYGETLEMIPRISNVNKKNNGMFHPIRLALNKEITFDRGGKSVKFPFESYEAGKLTFGNSNPTSTEFNSLADYYIEDETGILELRLPWLLLNFKDPSKKEIMGNIWRNEGLKISEFVDNILLAVVLTDHTGRIVDSVPKTEKDLLNDWISYSWDNWEEPTYHERLKKSYYILQNTFKSVE